MPSARSTLALVAALAYGTSVMAMPMQNSNDLVERDYSDIAELDARMYDMDIEEYYVRDATTPDATTTAAPASQTSGASTHHHKGSHHHGHKHHGHKAHGKKGGVAPTTTNSVSAPTPSSDAANSKLFAREPRGGRGGKHGGGKHRGHGRKHKEASAGGDAPAAEPVAERDLFDDADSELSAREPRGGRGGKHGGGKHRGHGRKHKEASAGGDAPAAEPVAERDFFDDAEFELSAREPRGGRGGKRGGGKHRGHGRKHKEASAGGEAPAAEPVAERDFFDDADSELSAREPRGGRGGKHGGGKHRGHGRKHKEASAGGEAPAAEPVAERDFFDDADSELSAREPRGGRGGKHGGGKHRGHGRKHKEASAGGDAPAAEPIAERGLPSVFHKKSKKTAEEKASVPSETTPEVKELDAATESSPATPSATPVRKHKKHSKKAGKRHGLHRLHRHKSSKKPTSTSSLATAATASATN